MNNECIFCKIIDKIIPANIIYEDDDMIAFKDIHPKADIHLLIIPKLHIASMLEINESHIDLLGKLMLRVNKIALEYKLEGYKIQINVGKKGGQEVLHLHIHLAADL